MKKRNWRMLVAAALLVPALAVPAIATADNDDGWWPRMRQMMGQWGPGNGQMMGRWGMGYMGGPMMGLDDGAMLDRIDGRLAFLKAELKITDDQAKAWDEFADTVRTTSESHNDMMRGMMKEFDSGEFLDKPLPDRLTEQEARMEARLEEVRMVRAAAEKLYAVLSDEQKKTADETVLPMMGMGMGRQRGMGPGRMGQ